jgi:hypothetical protein
MVPRACNTRFLKKNLIRLRYSTVKHFRVCSASGEIRSAYGQCAMKFIPRMLSMDAQSAHVKTFHILPLAEHARNFISRILMCDKIVSTYAQQAHAIIFKNH